LIRKPADTCAAQPADTDVLSNVLRSVRLTGSLQFCFMPTGAWQTEGKGALSKLADDAAIAIPFHIVVAGSCWLRMDGRQINLEAGDVLAFPFGTPHQLGAGTGGRLIAPVGDLPPKPWREVPVLRYGEAREGARACGYLQCDAIRFRPLRAPLPMLMHVRTADPTTRIGCATIDRDGAGEWTRPRAGALSMLERLTEITFIELLRHQVLATPAKSVGWLSALRPGAGAMPVGHPRRPARLVGIRSGSGVRPVAHVDGALRDGARNIAHCAMCAE
jgi:hypothetical protein